jgi:hypothetical protein
MHSIVINRLLNIRKYSGAGSFWLRKGARQEKTKIIPKNIAHLKAWEIR